MIHKFNLKVVGTFFLFASGCFGSEAGNPETAAVCGSFMFGLVEGVFEVPQNTSAIPLQFSESVREGVIPSFELKVILDGAAFTGFELTDAQGTVLDANRPLSGVVFFSPTVAFAQGSTLTMQRTLSCEQKNGDVVAAQPSEVVVKIGGMQPPPSSPGVLQVTDRVGSMEVALAMSEEVVPWRHLITQAELIVDGTRLSGSWLTSDDDRSFTWSLASVDCDACSKEESGSSAAPRVCRPHQWEAGQVDLSVEVWLAGTSVALASDTLRQTFEEPRCY